MTPLLAPRPRVDRALERLYRRHAADVYRYALGVLRNPADAEDVTQTTFMNAYRALERGEQPRAPLNWLIAIAHNVCRQRFRAASRRPQEVELDRDVAETLVVDDGSPTLDDMRRALGHLAFNQRAALVMREIEGRSYAEIAEVLDLSVSAVETLIFRARRALREQLEGSLTCDGAERAISKQLDEALSRSDKAQLRAHLRECPECATLARRQRAQRAALRSLGAIPLPQSLVGLFGGGGATIGLGIAAKTAAIVAAAGVVGAGGYDLHRALEPPRAPAKATAVTVAQHRGSAGSRHGSISGSGAVSDPTIYRPPAALALAAAQAAKAARGRGRTHAGRSLPAVAGAQAVVHSRKPERPSTTSSRPTKSTHGHAVAGSRGARKVPVDSASPTTGRALVPIPRSHAARGLRGIPLVPVTAPKQCGRRSAVACVRAAMR